MLLSAVALGLLALQCSSVHGSPAKHYDETIYTSEEDQYYQEPEDADDEEYETNNNMVNSNTNSYCITHEFCKNVSISAIIIIIYM